MKITKKQLAAVINEELHHVLLEEGWLDDVSNTIYDWTATPDVPTYMEGPAERVSDMVTAPEYEEETQNALVRALAQARAKLEGLPHSVVPYDEIGWDRVAADVPASAGGVHGGYTPAPQYMTRYPGAPVVLPESKLHGIIQEEYNNLVTEQYCAPGESGRLKGGRIVCVKPGGDKEEPKAKDEKSEPPGYHDSPKKKKSQSKEPAGQTCWDGSTAPTGKCPPRPDEDEE